jgi:hypothetical protein
LRHPERPSLSPFGLDLTDQDHRVLGDHAEQRQNSEDGDEAERLAGQQQRRDDVMGTPASRFSTVTVRTGRVFTTLTSTSG